MGDVKRVIADEVLSNRQHHYGNLWVDLCENLHIHLRNIRLELSKGEWDEIVMFLNSAKGEVDKFKDYKENSGTQIMFSSQLKSIGKNSAYCADRFRIEEENDGSVHIHYRDIRIHMTKEEYNQVANAMKPIPQESTNGS